MKNKIYIGFAILCITIFGMAILSNRNPDSKSSVTPMMEAWSSLKSMEHMAVVENELARIKAINEIDDYKDLFPDMYAVNDLPVSMEKGKKIAYLTFDDGPSENTFKILDILHEKGVSATFFVVGSTILEDEELCLMRMLNEGHAIGIHTYSHICKDIYCSIERFLFDFNIAFELIYEVTGERVKIYRFPYGSDNGFIKKFKDELVGEMNRRGFTYYDWNITANDSLGKTSVASIKKNILKDIDKKEYPVILLHDAASNDATVKALPQVIDLLHDKGYEFDTLVNRVPYQFKWE